MDTEVTRILISSVFSVHLRVLSATAPALPYLLRPYSRVVKDLISFAFALKSFDPIIS